jgi:chemotaxis protein CheX
VTVTAVDVDRVVVDTWTSLLDIAPIRLAQAPQQAATGDWVHAVVAVDGPWNGTVRVSAPGRLAARCAAAMLDIPLDVVDEATARDAFGELANVVGGNLKSLMPPVCHLSLPSFEPTQPAEPGALSLAFDCTGDPLVVTVQPQTHPRGLAAPD